MAQFVLRHLEVLGPTSGIRKEGGKEGMDVFVSLRGQTAVHPHPPAIAVDSGADSKVKGRQTTIAVNVFVFYCPPSNKAPAAAVFASLLPPSPRPPAAAIQLSCQSKAFAYVDLELLEWPTMEGRSDRSRYRMCRSL